MTGPLRALAMAMATAAAITASAAPARATCMFDCQAHLLVTPLDGTCAHLDTSQWPAGTPLVFVASCQTCCSPPGGPLDCDTTPPTPETFSVTTETAGDLVPGTFEMLAIGCEEGLVFRFDGDLVPGNYHLMQSTDGFGLILIAFEAVPMSTNPAECQTDDECPPCHVCSEAICIAELDPPACLTNADCGGYYCQAYADAACENYCTDALGCATDGDCPTCSFCTELGYCEQGMIGPGDCTTDEDCDAGHTCEAGPECGYVCVPQCMTDEDCGSCSVCVDGQCMGTGLVECVTDEDCGPGFACEALDPDDMCSSLCVDTGPLPECLEDTDCGPCEVCDEFACVAVPGLPPCSEGDCPAGQICYALGYEDQDAAWCKQTCVPGCATEDDCAGCQTCQAGACLGDAAPACVSDDDCEPDHICVVEDLEDACANACKLPGAPAECLEDVDCGPCATCEGTTCMATPGMPACGADADCPTGEVCRADGHEPGDATAWCLFQCVEPEGTTTTPPESDGVDGTKLDDPGCAAAPRPGLLGLALLAIVALALRRRRLSNLSGV